MTTYTILLTITLPLIFLYWGLFLNELAHFLVSGTPLSNLRFACPACHNSTLQRTTLPLFARIPFLKLLITGSSCTACSYRSRVRIPYTELLTAIFLTALYATTPGAYFICYFIFFSAMLITIATDMEYMLISRFASLFLAPIGLLLSFLNLIPLTPLESMAGALFGYLFLYTAAHLFIFVTKRKGIGQGDIELLACIGAFTGPVGCWLTLLVASVTGSIVGILLILFASKTSSTKIPFGPFLALGAMIYVLVQPMVQAYLLQF